MDSSPNNTVKKMKLLQFTQKKLEIVGIDSDENPFNQRILKANSICCISNISASVYFFHEANNFMEYTYSIYITTANMMITICYIIAITKMEDIFELFDNFENIINKRLRLSASKVIYENGNQQAEKWSSILFVIVGKTTPITVLLPHFIASFFKYFTTDLGNEAFELPIPMWIPFDWKNPVGYVITMSFLYIMSSNIFILIACMWCCGISVFLILIAVTKDVQITINSMKSNINTESAGQQQMVDELLDFIELHLIARENVHDASNISQPISMTLFVWSMVTTCSTMLMLQIELSQPDVDSFVILLTILFAFYSFGILFIVCEIGQRLSNDFIEITDTFAQTDWLRYPIGIKRKLPTILINLQEPVELFYYGANSCSRESMKKVYNKGFSYFMTLRNLEK